MKYSFQILLKGGLFLWIPLLGFGQTSSNNIFEITPPIYEPAENLIDSFYHEFQWSAETLLFGGWNGFASDKISINPDNRVAQLTQQTVGLFLRPSLKYQLKKERELLSVWLKPRMNLVYDFEESSELMDQYQMDFHIQELKARWEISQQWNLIIGRYIREMGTSTFINPSNPFLLDPGRINPKIEQQPLDYIELNFSNGGNWSWTLLTNIFEGENTNFKPPFFDFSRNYGLLANYYGNYLNLGLVAVGDERGKIHLGSFAQANISEAWVIYTDVVSVKKANRFYPIRGHWTDPQLLEFDMINGPQNDPFFFSGLLGASYTSKLGPTISLEYYYNGLGYNNTNTDLLFEQIASSAQYTFDVTKLLANINLARSINPGMVYIRKNYLFTQIGDQDVFDSLSYNFRHILSIDDLSQQFSALLEWQVNDIEFFSVILVNKGGRQTDLNRLIDHAVMLGLIYKL